MKVSISELKTNPGYYIDLSQNQRIAITKNGKVVANIISAIPSKHDSARKLIGSLPANLDYDALREERIAQ
ncbi:MAG: type II toxin-antitoxin system Phd/YefM family antitoxin [Coriobacteriia bacterium]|nr:type II toxin-antitoxin system Phd/YefM family antitoxin [Coriobacteriia bacterium]MCL2536768.1 type II toxin-antitoxin system Phd/YefM family antitoxin [Coriobacteriia bacterium]